ncbi:hypothetical protein DIURU_001477 [Diutina rugosa]|uniref:Sec1-like protein n=1 Tax=Diutina rugosa TaxID=5481 RepID=A0A642UU95_DIURU|nr:uncharacterized protein DIURU_001477 [Diutina rugosa]KAA8905404.1 hypothetical protein DIURU_001477 [Diutina rugosa]
MSLRDKQIERLEQMLSPQKKGELAWKVLIMDAKARAVVSSVLRVNDLLKLGVTLHASLSSPRSPMPDVSAVYLVEPTIDNVMVLVDDLQNDKYDAFYINFTSSLPRDLLEEFAKKVSLCGKASKIKSVWDQYIDFIVTEPNLFSLDMKGMFYKFSSSKTTEEEIATWTDRIASGLVAIVNTMGSIPIIRAPQGGAAEFVASQLNVKLRDHLQTNTGATSDGARPVLILLDRNLDLSSMFAHSWIYQVMVNDVFSLKRNTIKLTVKGENGQPKEKSYDVDPKDFFWNSYAQLPFPDVVEHADTELNLYKKDAADLTNKTGITSLDDIDNNAASTSAIQQAVDALPELTARKATLDMHMDILASLISELQAKSLDKFFEIESNCQDPKSLNEFYELLQSQPTSGSNTNDKYRTFLIMVLLVDLPEDYKTKVSGWFADHGVDLAAYNYITKFKQISNMTNLSDMGSGSLSGSGTQAAQSSALSSLSSKLYGLTEGRISEGLTSIASKVKSFIPEKRELPVTKVVQALMDPQTAPQDTLQVTDNYVYFDPKTRGSKQPKRSTYNESMVFMIGGANYYEYQNLQEWAEKSKKTVVYGGTDVIPPDEFLLECGELGKSS